jgi:phenylalanyl-tRNA synthetase beta chain
LKILTSWIKEFVDVDANPHEVADRLTMAGIETSSVTYLGDGFDNIVAGRIKKIVQHPKADKLTLCTVTDGQRDHQIVCGAPNINEGDTVPLALLGAKLPCGIDIIKAKIRGYDSEGMMCSERELGISDDHEGIMILPGGIEPGTPVAQALSLDDYLLEMEITPNRGDCLSVFGVAREVSAIFKVPIVKPPISFSEEGPPIEEDVSIVIEDYDLCPRYSSRVIYGVAVAASPLWLQRRLQLSGVRPINSIVDITNYILLELGQPMHAFDLDLLQDRRIVVKKAGDIESFTTLDGIERKIDGETLLIWDGRDPVAIAGIMGGENSEVKRETSRVLFESAHFNPLSIRKSRNMLGMSTESSYRFERGVDPAGTLFAIERALTILSRFSTFTVSKGVVDEKKDIIEYRPLWMRTAEAKRITGMEIEKKEAKKVFLRLGFELGEEKRGGMIVNVPSSRFDLTREIDLVEEVARILGYDRVPTTYPRAGSPHSSTGHEFIDFKKKISHYLAALGLFETINYSFISDAIYERLSAYSEDFSEQSVRLKNPISEDTQVLRPSLLPGLLRCVTTNISRYNKNLRLFEMGKIFKKSLNKNLYEENRLGVVFTGNLYTDIRSGNEVKVDYYFAKSVLLNLLSNMGYTGTWVVPEKTHRIFHPEISSAIKIDDNTAGYIGLLNEEVCVMYDILSDTYYFELNLDLIFGGNIPDKKYCQISKYPPVERDVSFLVDSRIPVGDILEYVKRVDQTIIADVSIFDIYSALRNAPGKKSVGLRVIYQSDNRTLTEQEVNDIHKKIIKLLENRFGGMVRRN